MGNSIRVFLWINFLIMLWFTYTAWIKDYSYNPNIVSEAIIDEAPLVETNESQPSLEANFDAS